MLRIGFLYGLFLEAFSDQGAGAKNTDKPDQDS